MRVSASRRCARSTVASTEVQALGAALRDRSGKPLQSAGHSEFALHTDESFLEHPANFVLLHC